MRLIDNIKEIWKKYNLIFKILISAFILYFVFAKLDFAVIINQFRNINLIYIIPCFLLALITLFFMVLKWKVFLKKYEKINLRKLIGIYWASDFVNLFGIGAVGSETYKMFSFKEKKKALFSSLIDRLNSFIWYFLLGISIIIASFFIGNESFFPILFGFLLFFILVFLYIFVEKRIKNKFFNFIKNKFIKKIIYESQRLDIELIKHSVYCLMIILLQVTLYYLIFLSIGLKVNLVELFIFVPLLVIALVLPISFQGFGIREFLFIEFAKLNSILPEKALIASFILYLITLVYRLLGVIPFILLRKKD